MSDRKFFDDTDDSYFAEVKTATDYYPFGMAMPGRDFSSGDYRYGFNGKEKDVNGEWGDHTTAYDYGFRIYNPSIGKFLSVDPLMRSYPMLTPYQFASNGPISNIDLDGLEGKEIKDALYYSGGKMKDVVVGTAEGIWTIMTTNPLTTIHGIYKVTKDAASDVVLMANTYTDILLYTFAGGDEPNTEGFNDAAHRTANRIEDAVYGEIVGAGIAVIGSKAGAEAKALKNKPCGCFTGGTIVKTGEGDKNIEDVEIGDKVWAYNEKTGETELKEVISVFTRDFDEVFVVYAGDVALEVTHEHPFYISNKWVKAQDLVVGDTLNLLKEGAFEVIDSIGFKRGDYSVYNFIISEDHTYFVSSIGVLVHNGNPCRFRWQKNKAMNDILSKSIHGDVYNKKGTKKIGEVGFELEGNTIVPNPLGRDLTNKVKDAIIKIGNEKLSSPDFRKSLLEKVNEALDSGQLNPNSNRVEKLYKMKKILSNE